MALQAKFRQVDEAIQPKRFDDNAELREKRDRVLPKVDPPTLIYDPTVRPEQSGALARAVGASSSHRQERRE